MRIPNKFNGYSRDGIRLYNDPATAAAIAAAGTSTGTMAGTALLGTGAATGLGTAAAATIPELAGAGALGSMTGGMELAAAASNPLLQGITAGTSLFEGAGLTSLLNAPTTAALSPEIAANLATANGLANVAPAAELGFQGFGAPVAEATGLQSLTTPMLEVPTVNPVSAMQTPVNATPEALGDYSNVRTFDPAIDRIPSEEYMNTSSAGPSSAPPDSSGKTFQGPGNDTSLRSGMPDPQNMTGSAWDDIK
jgi:hypothetical protein